MLAFTKIGLMPDGGASALVAAAVGRIRAMRMALLADKIHADEAFQAGLVTAVYPADELAAQVDKVIATLVRGPVIALAKTKDAINATTLTELEGALERETHRTGGAAAGHRLPRGHQSLSGTTRGHLHRLVKRRPDGQREIRWTRPRSVRHHQRHEHAIRHRAAGSRRRPMARARTVPVARVPPADHRCVAVDLRRGHVGGRDGASGDRARQQPRVAVARGDVLGRGVRRLRSGRRNRRGPDQPAHDHHCRRVRQRDRVVGHRGAGTGWCAAGLAYGGGLSGDGHRGGVLLPRVQRDPAANPARRPTSGGQRRRRRCAPGVPARRRPRGRRHAWSA